VESKLNMIRITRTSKNTTKNTTKTKVWSRNL